MMHSGYKSRGENVAAGTWRGLGEYNWFTSDLDVINAWYHEPFSYGASNNAMNHFTQVVWQATTRVGCAWASCLGNEYEFWVCQYTPQGNFNANATYVNSMVPKPCRTQSQCSFLLNGMNLATKFGSKETDAMAANQINVATYNYGANTCKTPLSAYSQATNPICVSDSTILPKTIDVTVQNPTSTGALTVTMNCPSGKALSGTGAVTCTSSGTWNMAGTCGGSPVTAAPPPPSPATTKSPATPAPPSVSSTGCWSSTYSNTYLSAYPSGWTYKAGLSLDTAKSVCASLSGCGGLTQTTAGWEPRAGTSPLTSDAGESSILKLSCGSSTTKAPTSAPSTPNAPTTPGKCYGPLLQKTYLYLYPNGYSPPTTSSLSDAQAACLKYSDCGGVTWTGSRWEARKGTSPMTSSSGEQSYLVVSCGVATWSPNSVAYGRGQCVQYNGNSYTCLQAHVSQAGWAPNTSPTLWQQTTSCPITAQAAESSSGVKGMWTWLIPLLAVCGAFIIAISLLLRHKNRRWRAYSGDLGTPEVATIVTGEEGADKNLTSPSLATQHSHPVPPTTAPPVQNQPTYSQIPTSPTTQLETPFSPSTQAKETESLFPKPQTEAPASSEQQPTEIPPPSDWQKLTDKDGQPYYYNTKSGVSQWELPDSL